MISVEKLAPYLAHGLQFYGNGRLYNMVSLDMTGCPELEPVGGGRVINIAPKFIGVRYKPILRPFTLFVNNSEWEKGYQKMMPKGYDASWHMSAFVSTKKSSYFFKHKFDVFGLIEEGLAEDATKLNDGIY